RRRHTRSYGDWSSDVCSSDLVGDARWFQTPGRTAELADGFAEGCRLAEAVWGGGETPALKGIVDPETIVLAGSVVGQIKPKSHQIGRASCREEGKAPGAAAGA